MRRKRPNRNRRWERKLRGEHEKATEQKTAGQELMNLTFIIAHPMCSIRSFMLEFVVMLEPLSDTLLIWVSLHSIIWDRIITITFTTHFLVFILYCTMKNETLLKTQTMSVKSNLSGMSARKKQWGYEITGIFHYLCVLLPCVRIKEMKIFHSYLKNFSMNMSEKKL